MTDHPFGNPLGPIPPKPQFDDIELPPQARYISSFRCTSEIDDFGRACYEAGLRARQAPAHVEVSRLASEIKIRALNAASLPRDPQPRTLQLKLHDEAVERLASMASTPAGEVPAGWQPIETAPKTDKTRRIDIWLVPAPGRQEFFTNELRSFRATNAYYNGSEGSGWTSPGAYNDRHRNHVVTHWMPLPAAPRASEPEAQKAARS